MGACQDRCMLKKKPDSLWGKGRLCCLGAPSMAGLASEDRNTDRPWFCFAELTEKNPKNMGSHHDPLSPLQDLSAILGAEQDTGQHDLGLRGSQTTAGCIVSTCPPCGSYQHLCTDSVPNRPQNTDLTPFNQWKGSPAFESQHPLTWPGSSAC